MFEDRLTPEARRENALMLASALGVDASEADEALQFDISITADETDTTAIEIANELVAILGRTIRKVEINGLYEEAALEVIIGSAAPRTTLEKLFVGLSTKTATIGNDQSTKACDYIPRIYAVLVACYLCAAVMQKVFKGRLPFGGPFPIKINFDELGVDPYALTNEIDIGTAYLAGAGAIGNSLLWALRGLKVRGRLNLVDDDVVSPGNLNRQILFTRNDLNKPKADRLAQAAQAALPNLTLVPRQYRLQDLPEKSEGPWLKRLIVAVDSRRARRAIQKEFPGEVFDASTTDIREVVVHYNRQPGTLACLSCIYESDEEELSREAHIAEHLGVSINEVRTERISEQAAVIIAAQFPKLDKATLIGLAYDTLFKQLCGKGELKTLEGRRVVAPFAFVSILAGTLLALELVRRLGSGNSNRDFNYWRVSPWHAPLHRRQVTRPKQGGCEFCGKSTLAKVNQALWGISTRP